MIPSSGKINNSEPPAEDSTSHPEIINELVQTPLFNHGITINEYEVNPVKSDLITVPKKQNFFIKPRKLPLIPSILFITFAIMLIIGLITAFIVLFTLSSSYTLKYGEICESNSQCNTTNGLLCISRKCGCSYEQYYDGSTCSNNLISRIRIGKNLIFYFYYLKATKKIYGSTCSSSNECNQYNSGLSCINSICNCSYEIQYYSIYEKCGT